MITDEEFKKFGPLPELPALNSPEDFRKEGVLDSYVNYYDEIDRRMNLLKK